MFTFKNPNTPIIASGTSVTHNGVTYTITAGVLQYFYRVEADNGRDLGLVLMGGKGHDWQSGVDAVEALIRKADKNLSIIRYVNSVFDGDIQ